MWTDYLMERERIRAELKALQAKAAEAAAKKGITYI
jgi:hypothetical protein